jgi:hypothetical protein
VSRKWKPYGDPQDPGAWLTLTNAYPTPYGTYRCAPVQSAFFSAGAGPATPGTTLSAWCGLNVNGGVVGYVGTTTKLYEITSASLGTFTDRSKGGGYTVSGGEQWRFVHFGNITITCSTDFSGPPPQARDSTGSSAFADLGGSPPQAKILVVQSNAVVMLNYDDGVNVYGDGWWASDVGDHTTWTPGSGNEAANGRILSHPGAITAALPFGDHIVVWKRSSMHRLRYAGSPVYWVTEDIARGVGVLGMGAVTNCGDFIHFITERGSYIYDGAGIRPVGSDGLYKYGASTSDLPLYSPASSGVQGGLHYPGSGAIAYGNGDGVVPYNLISERYGKVAPTNSSGSALTSHVPLAGDAEARKAFLGGGGHAEFGSGGYVMVNLSANPCITCDDTANSNVITSTLGTGYIGNERVITQISRIVPMWTATEGKSYSLSSANGAYSCVVNHNSVPFGSGTNLTSVNSSTSQHRFDSLIAARFIKATITALYDYEVADVFFDPKTAGTN